jgi:hypothetical protein
MLSAFRLRSALRGALLALVLLAGSALPAASDIQLYDLKPCECLDCLKLLRLDAQAERKAYEDRLPKAIKAMLDEIDLLKKPAYLEQLKADGRLPFCELFGVFQDEIGVVREIDIPEIHDALFVGETRKCMPLVGVTTDPANCEIDQEALFHNKLSAPCDQVHLAFLAHELVHVEDCKRNKDKPLWKENLKGATCNEAFKGKATPTNAQFMDFVKRAFETEVHAHDVESKVEALLANELKKQCKPEDYSSNMKTSKKYKEARKFLERAQKYTIKYP